MASRVRKLAALVAVGAALAGAAAHADEGATAGDCAARADRLQKQLVVARMAMDGEGALRGAFRSVVAAVGAMPGCEALWDLALRLAAADGVAKWPLAIAGRTVADLDGLVALAVEKLPGSEPIAVFAARRDPTHASPLLDHPSTAPGWVAHAASLLARGDADGARAALGHADLDTTVDGWLVMARLEHAAHHEPEAIAAARRVRKLSAIKLVEPAPPSLLRDAETGSLAVEGAAEVASGSAEAGARLLLEAAARGSREARASLEDATLRPTVAKLLVSRKRKLPPAEAAIAREVTAPH